MSRTPLMNSPLSDADGVEEARQILGRHGQVGVEDHQDVAGRRREAHAHRVTLAAAGLPEQARVRAAGFAAIARSMAA